MNLAYAAYLNSPEWAELRKLKFDQNGYRCQGCSGDERLEVHHLTYERLGHERLEDLQVLCHFCHAKEHGRSPHHIGPVAGPSIVEIQAQVLKREQKRQRVDEAERKLEIRRKLHQIKRRERPSPATTAKLRAIHRKMSGERSSPFRRSFVVP